MKQAFVFWLVWGLSGLLAAAQPRRAPASARAIICLTYDDGLPSHLATVLPQLEAAGLKATFFLNAFAGAATVLGAVSPAVAGWTAAAANGHELANHTLFHACPEKLGWPRALAIESYTVERLLLEIKTQTTLLALVDPSRKERAFAYPCNNFMIGSTDYSSIIRKQGLITYGRAGGDRTTITADFARLDPLKMPSWMVEEGTSLPELIAFAERVKQAGGMGIYQFHGIGAEFFTVSAETHRAFLAYLQQHQNEYWVATFSEAMDCITHQKGGPKTEAGCR